MMQKIIDLLIPILIHLFFSEVVIFVLGFTEDATLLTGVTSVVTFPFLWMLYRQDQKERMGKERKVPLWVYFLAAVTGILANQILSSVLSYVRITEWFSNETQESLLSSGLLTKIICLGVLVPVLEELLFRGLIYERCKKVLPVWASVLCGAALFALYHGNMVQILFAFPMGILLILFYQKWNRLSVPVVMHMAVNVSTVFFQHYT